MNWGGWEENNGAKLWRAIPPQILQLLFLGVEFVDGGISPFRKAATPTTTLHLQLATRHFLQFGSLYRVRNFEARLGAPSLSFFFEKQW